MGKLGVVVGTACLIFSTFATSKPQKLICTTTNWKPYVQENAEFHGYTHALVVHAFKQAGFDVDVRFMPWSSALSAVKEGKADVVFPLYHSVQREKDFVFSDPFSGGPLGLYKLKTQNVVFPKVDAAKKPEAFFKALSAYRFGVVKDYAYYPAFDNNHDLKKVAVLDDEANLQQLQQGKVDFVIMDKFVANYLLAHGKAHAFASAIEFVPPQLTSMELHIAMSKQNKQNTKVMKRFNKGLKDIGANGTLSHLLDQDSKRMKIRALA